MLIFILSIAMYLLALLAKAAWFSLFFSYPFKRRTSSTTMNSSYVV
jgi:hypothetical protein